MRGFLADIYLRPSCYSCPVKCGKSGSDLTLGDFWGLQSVMPELDDDKGMTALLVNNTHGQKFVNKIGIDLWQTTYESVFKGNPSLESSVVMSRKRELFFADSNISFEKKIRKYTRLPLKQQIRQKAFRCFSAVLSDRQKTVIKKLLGR